MSGSSGIHLNPLRAGIVTDLSSLDKYPYCGHSALMGKLKRPWQDTNCILQCYNEKQSIARRRYRAYTMKGIDEGRRPDLMGGGLKGMILNGWFNGWPGCWKWSPVMY